MSVGADTIDFAVDPARLSYDERMRLLERIEVETSRLAALRARTLAAVEAGDTSAKRWAREEVALAMRVAPATAVGYVKEADYLVSALPHTLAALEAGTLNALQARALVEATWTLAPQVAAAVEERCLTRHAAGHGATAGLFRALVHRAVAVCDPRGVEAKHAAAAADRSVSFRDGPNGMSELHACLPTDSAARLQHTLDIHTRATRTLPDGSKDPRTADQRRADALVDLATDTSAATGSPGPAVQVTVAASTLLGLDDLPGELDGHGAVPASMARALATDPRGTWRRILTDRAGRVVDLSDSYTPPAALCRLVSARDRRCRFPRCTRRATTCEIDHVIAWPAGPSAAWNLHPLCARHHHLKHEAAGWSVRRLDDGTTRWRTPSGRVIDVPPDTHQDLPQDWTPADNADLDVTAPIGGYWPEAPPDLDEPPDLDDRDCDDHRSTEAGCVA